MTPSPPDDTAAPPNDQLARAWWDATRERRLILQHCTACGHTQHYPRRLCTGCGATDALAWADSAGTGTVDAFTVVHRTPHPGPPAPYVVARVRLAEGPILLTNLVDVRAEDDLLGAEVVLEWRPLPDGRNLPVFTSVRED